MGQVVQSGQQEQELCFKSHNLFKFYETTNQQNALL